MVHHSSSPRVAKTYGTPAFAAMRAKCIGQELSWEKPAKKWESVLDELFTGSPVATAAKVGPAF